ncbi:MAG: tyrosine-protein phosphatase [Campylobacterota bacterium]|nr:tyrosine-protein phosphatase [Campylobacterota bacterium]
MKKILTLLTASVLIAIGLTALYKHLTYQFETITENRVYKSGAMPPETLIEYVKEYKIKTVIDLRHQDLHDALNPGTITEIMAERKALEGVEGVNHVHIPSGQIPSQKTLTKFYEVLDDNSSYPVLIHCYHGTGRAMIYSSLYRIEYENWGNEQARDKTRLLVKWSSFDEGKGKGNFLIHYKKRDSGEFDSNHFKKSRAY